MNAAELKQVVSEMPEGFYSRRTEDGEVWAKDYTFRKKTYRQETLTMRGLLALADLFFELDLKNKRGEIADVSDIGVDISVKALLAALVKARAHARALAIVLVREDGTDCDPAEFEHGTAAEFLGFAEAVVVDFFTFNSDVSSRLSDWFVRASGVVAEKMTGLLRRVVPYISSALATSQKETEFSESGKRSPTSGRRKR